MWLGLYFGELQTARHLLSRSVDCRKRVCLVTESPWYSSWTFHFLSSWLFGNCSRRHQKHLRTQHAFRKLSVKTSRLYCIERLPTASRGSCWFARSQWHSCQ